MQKTRISTSRLAVVLVLVCTGLLGALKYWIQRDAHAGGILLGDAVALARQSVLNAITVAGDRLVAVGENGIVLLSDDWGRTWRSAQVPVRRTLGAVRFLDTQVGIAVGEQGVILRTADRGETWKVIAGAGADFSPPLLAVERAAPGVAIALGGFGKALISQDAGLTWTSMKNQLPNASDRHLYGYAGAGNFALIAGESGTLIRRDAKTGEAAALATPYEGSFFGALAAPDTMLVFGLRGSVFASANEGRSWTRCPLGTEAAVTGAAVSAQGDVLLATMNGEVFKAKGGSCSFSPAAVRYPGPATGLIAGPDGSVVLVGARGVLRASDALK